MDKSKWLVYIYLMSLAFGMALVLVPLMKRLAARFGILDNPGPRKVHQRPVPLLGGAAVVASFMTVVLVNYLAFVWIGEGNLGFMPCLMGQYNLAVALWPRLRLLLASALLIFGVGLLDDIVGVNFDYRLKFIIQFAVAGVLVAQGIVISIFSFLWLNRLVTVLWIVGITNAFNLLDNMDGLSSGVAILATGIFFIVACQQGQFFMAMILIALLGSMLGFYPYNFPRSTVFLGDNGSLFIGFMLGTLTVIESYVTADSPTLFPVVMPLLVLSVPLFDTFSVMYIRFREERPLFVADKCHLSHRLVAFGMNKWQAVLCIYLFTLILGVNSLLLVQLSRYGGLIVFCQGLLVIALISIFILFGTYGARGEDKHSSGQET